MKTKVLFGRKGGIKLKQKAVIFGLPFTISVELSAKDVDAIIEKRKEVKNGSN